VEVLAFGIAPGLPPVLAIALALLVAVACLVVPRWAASPAWTDRHVAAMVTGAIVANCLVLYASFTDPSSLDFIGKTALDAIAFVALGWLVRSTARA
jgi:multisubunit Na+/H+ antiporter MnhF subunit